MLSQCPINTINISRLCTSLHLAFNLGRGTDIFNLTSTDARKNQSAEVLQKKEVYDISYVSKAHAMIIERQKVEELRRRACEERSGKKAIAELKKVHKQTKKWRKNW